MASKHRKSKRVVRFSKLSKKGEKDVRSIVIASIADCPFLIISPDHYRDDGTCKCDDARERAHLIRTARFEESDFASIPLRSLKKGQG